MDLEVQDPPAGCLQRVAKWTRNWHLCHDRPMPRARAVEQIEVGLVVVPETAPAVLYGLYEVFSTVGSAWEGLTGRPAGSVRMRVRLVAETEAPMVCAFGAPIRPDAIFATTPRLDLVIATDLLFDSSFEPRGHWPAATAWLKAQYDGGAIVASVCTGAVLLAEAGLLDGLEATTHWAVVGLLRSHYPAVCLQPGKVLALAGEGHRVVTAGGAASWTELALYLIGRLCGPEEAVRSSKIFLLGDRSEGQLPFAAMTRPPGEPVPVIERCQVWIATHYETPNPVACMVEQSGLAARTFKRRFQAATGYTPIEYVQTLRIEEAKQLLETTDLATDAVGASVGYADPASFRRLFRRLTGVTPARYRQRLEPLRKIGSGRSLS